jgi:hypothetical protein
LAILPCLAMATGANATATAAARQLLRGRPRPRCDWENGTPGTFFGWRAALLGKKSNQIGTNHTDFLPSGLCLPQIMQTGLNGDRCVSRRQLSLEPPPWDLLRAVVLYCPDGRCCGFDGNCGILRALPG